MEKLLDDLVDLIWIHGVLGVFDHDFPHNKKAPGLERIPAAKPICPRAFPVIPDAK